MTGDVLDNPSQQRFELEAQGHTAFIAYRRRGEVFSLDHTEVPEEMSGGGVGSALVKGALELVRKQGGKVIARCSFVAAYIDRHAEYRTLLSE
jgi:predicted GNAT family acetyltransferase